ncbi:Uncharacterised protein [Brucella neotomae]|nr:Uncharacterised protein [Brucella neotomae]
MGQLHPFFFPIHSSITPLEQRSGWQSGYIPQSDYCGADCISGASSAPPASSHDCSGNTGHTWHGSGCRGLLNYLGPQAGSAGHDAVCLVDAPLKLTNILGCLCLIDHHRLSVHVSVTLLMFPASIRHWNRQPQPMAEKLAAFSICAFTLVDTGAGNHILSVVRVGLRGFPLGHPAWRARRPNARYFNRGLSGSF